MSYQTANIVLLVLSFSIVALDVIFPFMTLFGFFESRKGGNYQFRTRRFATTIICLIVLNFLGGVILDYGIADLMIGASQVAEPAVLSNRTAADYGLRNQAAIFPKELNDAKISCYRAAVSNYIEDQWNKYVHDESCKSAYHICANSQTEYYSALLKKYREQYKQENLIMDLSAVGIVLNSIWATSADMYASVRRFYQSPDDKGKISPPPDAQMLADYRHYFDTCTSLKPLPWATRGDELLTVHPHLCFGGCS